MLKFAMGHPRLGYTSRGVADIDIGHGTTLALKVLKDLRHFEGPVAGTVADYNRFEIPIEASSTWENETYRKGDNETDN